MVRKRLNQAANAPVAQWIEQRFPKPRAQVRFLPGALHLRAIDDLEDLLDRGQTTTSIIHSAPVPRRGPPLVRLGRKPGR